MLRLVGKAVLILVMVSLVFIGVLFYWFSRQPEACRNEVISESSSPNGKIRIVVFQRDCGGTTGFSTQASVLSTDQPLQNDEGNLFIADTGHGVAPAGHGGGPSLRVAWESNQSVVLTYHPKARVFYSATEVEGVRARYVTVP